MCAATGSPAALPAPPAHLHHYPCFAAAPNRRATASFRAPAPRRANRHLPGTFLARAQPDHAPEPAPAAPNRRAADRNRHLSADPGENSDRSATARARSPTPPAVADRAEWCRQHAQHNTTACPEVGAAPHSTGPGSVVDDELWYGLGVQPGRGKGGGGSGEEGGERVK